ncbi:NAD-dependent deacylase [Mesobacterium sp. TK19101]|uniref:NAD-dependent protein deacylase n=1 Tax=Mesobacterium hydrothermale TaxID=3111907 RepID=A0ABU6HMB7_9RHOB|nr:NAD-dependent deacylase [Mesobacterium sp. TK19101]MEC3862598.1 NAD-dependent deacylase [Mesobacterium sp. TK19101]
MVASKIVILTGAGISAESGLGTFRDNGGLWDRHRIEDVATPEAFARDPDLVHSFYNTRRAQAAQAEPNPAHFALAWLQADWPGEVVIVTQNVDWLHEKAGGTAIHMHGELSRALCANCGHRSPAPLVMTPADPCRACGARATRPDIVWFGEIPYRMEEIADHLHSCDLFVAIGTSGQVYPAAGFVTEAAYAGARTLEINMTDSETSAAFDDHRVGLASQTVPAWVTAQLDGVRQLL